MPSREVMEEGVDLDRGAQNYQRILNGSAKPCNQVHGTKPCVNIGEHDMHQTADGEQWSKAGRRTRSDAGRPRERKQESSAPSGMLSKEQGATLRNLINDARDAEEAHAAAMQKSREAEERLNAYLDSLTKGN